MAFRWWINTVFAIRDGIIDKAIIKGGVCADETDAYAIVLVGSDEQDSNSPDSFTYRAPYANPGRYQLTSATSKSRNPIRVLRSHKLHSLWAPSSGVRYDGL
jgi:hypothetical protein